MGQTDCKSLAFLSTWPLQWCWYLADHTGCHCSVRSPELTEAVACPRPCSVCRLAGEMHQDGMRCREAGCFSALTNEYYWIFFSGRADLRWPRRCFNRARYWWDSISDLSVVLKSIFNEQPSFFLIGIEVVIRENVDALLGICITTILTTSQLNNKHS